MLVTTRTLAATALAVALACGSALAQDMLLPDRIVPISGAPLPGIKITAADVTGLTYVRFSGEGETKKIEFEKVGEVYWGDTPNELRRAIADFKAGKFDEALKSVAKAPEDAARAFWYKPYRLLLEGQCLLRTGKPAEALARLDAVLTKYPRSYYEVEAILNKGECHMALKEYEKGAEAFAKLDPKEVYATASATEPYGKIWQLRGREKMAAALAKSPGKADEAAAICDKLAQVTEAILAELPADQKELGAEITGIQQRSLIGQVEVLLAADKLDAARERADLIASKITDKPSRLRLFLALGELSAKVAEKTADGKDKAVRLKEAALSYMRVYILYPDQKPERLRAMMGAATAFQLLGTPADKAHAARLYREIVSEFPGTPEATEAPRRLEAMGMK